MKWQARRKPTGWVRWFAWYPVKTWEGDWLWLEVIAKNIFGRAPHRYLRLDLFEPDELDQHKCL